MSGATELWATVADRSRDAYYRLGDVVAARARERTDLMAVVVRDLPAVSRALSGVVLSGVLSRVRWAHRLGGPVGDRGAGSLGALLKSDDPEGELTGERGAELLRALDLDPRATSSALAVLDEREIGGEYAALDIAHLGRAYEGIADLRLASPPGRSIALRPSGQLVDLDALATAKGEIRVRVVERAALAKLAPATRSRLVAAVTADEVVVALKGRASSRYPEPLSPGAVAVVPSGARRSQGAHFTPDALCKAVAHRALAPLLSALGPAPGPAEILELKVCDPAMGAGAFLLAAGDLLAEALAAAHRAHTGRELGESEARRRVVPCLYGVDRDPIAVALARRVLWLWVGAPAGGLPEARRQLRHGDALVGLLGSELVELAGSPERQRLAADALLAVFLAAPDKRARTAAERQILDLARAWAGGALSEPALRRVVEEHSLAEMGPAFHWELELPEVFRRPRGGFDAILGNPPWVAYAGRAAQPLNPALFDFFVSRYRAFFGYRTQHGLFVERAARLLAPKGRLGLVLPTSVSDLDGYEPVRHAHDELCEVDADLPDFGADAFEGVFQPAMALLSTRRARPPRASRVRAGSPWGVSRTDLDADARALLGLLMELPALPREAFGERGFQTTKDDVRKLVDLRDAGAGACGDGAAVPLREGSDISEYFAGPPRRALDPATVTGRLRPPGEWRAVGVLIRQTARYPIAALSDGAAFRNSLLAGFASDVLDAAGLVAYLNASLVRWHHYMRYRDARQGMPQVKIAHLRSIPAPPAALAKVLSGWGEELSRKNRGIELAERRAIDDEVHRAFGLAPKLAGVVDAFRAAMPR